MVTYLVRQATATNLKTQSNTYDGSGTAITSTSSALDVNIKSGAPTSVTADTELETAAALADAQSNPTLPRVGSMTSVFQGTAATWARQRAVENTMNTDGRGVAAAGLVGQFDDTSPTAISENSFGPVRISTNRNLYSTIRDAAGNERGVNVNSSNQLSVSVDNTPTVTANAGTNLNTSTLATSTNITGGSQKTQVVDGSGNVITTNSTTTTSKFGLDNNILSILGHCSHYCR